MISNFYLEPNEIKKFKIEKIKFNLIFHSLFILFAALNKYSLFFLYLKLIKLEQKRIII